jgi:hypothetical protein
MEFGLIMDQQRLNPMSRVCGKGEVSGSDGGGVCMCLCVRWAGELRDDDACHKSNLYPVFALSTFRHRICDFLNFYVAIISVFDRSSGIYGRS